MLIEATGICQRCAASVTMLIYNGEPRDECPECNQSPFITRKIKGLIYVVWNKNQDGVKVGLTTKTIDQRIKSLNSTGVPDTFIAIAIFPSERPEADERRVHEKLRRYNIAREHFDLDPIEVVRLAFRALNNRRPIFSDPEHEKTFKLRCEEERIKMQLKLRPKLG